MNLRLTGFQKLALSSVVATYVMVVIGVVVRSTGSGMGCPDWPLCNGQVIPALGDTAAWLESIHRWWGVIVGFLVLGLVISAVRTQRATRSVVVGSFVALAIVGFQAYLGKLTVDMNNSAETVLAHLATAMILLGTFIFVFVRSRFPAELPRHGAACGCPCWWASRPSRSSRCCSSARRRPARASTAAAAGCAALIFPEWPLFDGQLIPTFSADAAVANLQMRQFAHRIVAAIVGVIVLVTTVVVWRPRGHGAPARDRSAGERCPAPTSCSRLVGTAAALFAIQVMVGALQIWMKLEWWVVSLHLALGSLIWGLLWGAALVGWYRARAVALEGAPDAEDQLAWWRARHGGGARAVAGRTHHVPPLDAAAI